MAEATQTYIAEPLMRVIYDQDLAAHAFSSLVAFTSVIGSDSVTDGNSKLVEALFTSSAATVSLNTTVTRVIRNLSSPKGYTIESEHEGVKQSRHADQVVIATPFEYSGIEFVNVTLEKVETRKFVHCHVTLVMAQSINPVYFGAESGTNIPENILTTQAAASTTPFNVLQLEANLEGGRRLYKLFSNGELSDEIPKIFTNVSSIQTQDWPYTFPVLAPVGPSVTSGYQPIRLAENIYYLNTIESVASAMEGSIIAGRNVALLIQHQNQQNRTTA